MMYTSKIISIILTNEIRCAMLIIEMKKFEIGDKVRFNDRVPDFVATELRRRTRTIVGLLHDPEHKCCYYELGDRGKGTLGYYFRSYMLVPVNGNGHTIGRPQKLLLSDCSQKLEGFSSSQVLNLSKEGKMTPKEAGRLGQKALRDKLGADYHNYMKELGKRGFQATIIALTERQNIPANLNYNPFRNLLANLQRGKL
jgi:hypothetical protein